MYIQKLIPVILSVMLMSACTTSKEEIVITVSGEVISTGYIGNGVEWDPYDEAEAWGGFYFGSRLAKTIPQA